MHTSGSDTGFCTPRRRRTQAPLRGVIGVMSHEPRRRHRDAVRANWLTALPDAVRGHFLIRGIDPIDRAALDLELAANADVILLPARSNMSQHIGPLQSLLLWFECFHRVYADVPFIGKADDDIWLRTVAIEPLLHSAEVLAGHSAVYVGHMEAYSWSTAEFNEGAMENSFSFAWPKRECSRDRPAQGPFPFAKGALFVLSARLSGAVLAWAKSSGEAAHLLGNDAKRCYLGSPAQQASTRTPNGSFVSGPCRGRRPRILAPVEDVWLGHALSLAAKEPVTYLDVPVSMYSLFPWGFSAMESLLVWHSNADDDFPRRVAIVSRWAANASRPTRCLSWWSMPIRCRPRLRAAKALPWALRQLSNGSEAHLQAWHQDLQVDVDWAGNPSTLRSCRGQPIRRCRLLPPAGCDTSKVDLWRLPGAKLSLPVPPALRSPPAKPKVAE